MLGDCKVMIKTLLAHDYFLRGLDFYLTVQYVCLKPT